MSSLSMLEARLPPGFRFHPRDDELVCDYLAKKLSGHTDTTINENSYGLPIIVEVDLNKCEPWDLPEMACIGGKEWYFFCLRDRKYATGQRTNRATESGYWKATGKDRKVNRRGVLVGMRKTLVFYEGRAPKGKKSDWVMHEYRIEGFIDQTKFLCKEDWVLCRIIDKSRSSSKPNIETCYDDDKGSSSLPSLTDTYIAFEQSPMERYEQVPCFSNISQNLAGQSTYVPLVPLVETNFALNRTSNVKNLDDFGPTDDKVLKAVLNHFKLEGNPKSEYIPNSIQGSFENYLSENGFSYMWGHL